jgi:hypothetical protein
MEEEEEEERKKSYETEKHAVYGKNAISKNANHLLLLYVSFPFHSLTTFLAQICMAVLYNAHTKLSEFSQCSSALGFC